MVHILLYFKYLYNTITIKQILSQHMTPMMIISDGGPMNGLVSLKEFLLFYISI